jgi:trimethyllysine dioxygenase
MFHLIEFNGDGGQTLLVDAFRVAHEMRTHHRDDYETLCRIPVPSQYLDRVRMHGRARTYTWTHALTHAHGCAMQRGKIELRPLDASPIFVRGAAADAGAEPPLLQVRYNNDDRAPLRGLSVEDVAAFYRAHRTFNRLIRDPRLEYRFQLSAGTVLLFDNHRLLHGRTAFRGHRRLIGCYLNGDDYRSRLRGLVYARDHRGRPAGTPATDHAPLPSF